jgi:predicted SAM-dependent methyltransferase
MASNPIKLNIGAGATSLPGFIPIDRKNGTEATRLDYADDTVDEVYASHVLEHFGFGEIQTVLEEWVRVLKPGGRIRIAVPDFDYIAKRWVETSGNGRDTHEPDKFTESQMLRRYAMGGQIDENDFHKSAFDEQGLTTLMRHVGIRGVKRWDSEIQDCASLPVSLNLEGTKSESTDVEGERHGAWIKAKIAAVMSAPKLGFTENFFCATQVLIPRGVQLTKNTGAFWGQCMERCMVDAIEAGAEWILTLDYDTGFTAEQFERLCYEMVKHPEADAIAPWQVKRETDDPLCWFLDEHRKPRVEIPLTEFEVDVTKANHAHFGLTLFRVSALLKMDHPWFWSKPAPDGMWGDGRHDDDIYFWNKWEEAGNTLYLANHVTIGHLQQMISWVGRDCKPIHQYVTDFQQNGPPKGIRQ